MIKNDLTGKTFGWWTVLGFHSVTSYRKVIWMCQCKCGTRKPVAGQSLTNGSSIRCQKHARFTTHGKSRTPEYNIWTGIKDRCYNENNSAFQCYGGRGIKLCKRWDISFKAFLEDMGTRPTPLHTIDRINSNGNYEPNNCRWATRKEQSRNTRRNRWINHNGKTMLFADWAKFLGIHRASLYERLLKWPIEKALTPRQLEPKSPDYHAP